jgi:putative ABC transport system substrate-binding protein
MRQKIPRCFDNCAPADYPLSVFATDGGLISYGSDAVDQFRKAASYGDRILKGIKPADFPVM